VRYLAPFEVIKKLVEISTSGGQLVAAATYEDLIKMIRLLLSAVEVDEEWYLFQYPDVAEAISDGRIESARQHFIGNGYFEGRIPFAISVDDKWYRNEYPDVAESMREGGPSAQAHFIRDGYREGRLPFQQA
jgi:hypothetical protein